VERIYKDTIPAAAEFLQGGFLHDKNTVQAIHLENPLSFLVLHKDKIDHNGRLILSKITLTGNELWRFETGLKELMDWSSQSRPTIGIW
jgi:hypothetical protein